MTKAEESALRAYPYPDFNAFRDTETAIRANSEMANCRKYYIEGYEQAEKDLALTWEDMKKIDCIFRDVATEHTIGKFNPANYQEWYTEALKRFNEQRKK